MTGDSPAPPPLRSSWRPRLTLPLFLIMTAMLCWILSLHSGGQVGASPIVIRPSLSRSSGSVQKADLPVSQANPTSGTKWPVSKRDFTRPEDAVLDLVKRLLPSPYHDHFQFSLKPDLVSGSTSNIYDTFRVANGDGGKIIVEGATVSALGVGLNYYLKNMCQVELTWSGDRFKDLPTVPPMMPQTASGKDTAGGTIRASFVPWRYYMNVVTFGYSYAFWDWPRWERELDWMLLNGVNMALSMVGQEYVLRQFYENQGISLESLNDFLSSPAFMPWQRMGNIQGSWGFPDDTRFKADWIDTQWELQIQIMKRMQDFNITPIMPSFNGFVPRELVPKYPTTKFENASMWAEMPDPYSRVSFVPSTESLFGTLSQQFIRLQTSMYAARGLKTDLAKNFYLLDLYNELNPTCVRVDCLQQATSGVMKALKAADPKAVWVMQAWFLERKEVWGDKETKAFFDGIRQTNEGRDAFVIDLYSDVAPLWDSTQGFYGIDWGWSMLNNFGGGQGLYGTLPTLLTNPFRGYQQPAKTMRGMGITMEGINNNEYLYQLILDLPWQDPIVNRPLASVSTEPSSILAPMPMPSSNTVMTEPPLDGQQHLESYIKRRYGPNQTSQAMLEAWTTLSQTVWDCRTQQMSQSKSYLDGTPALNMRREGFMTSIYWYDQTKVVQAWQQLVQSTETEVSKKRRRNRSVIQNSIENVLRAAGGLPDLETRDLSSDGSDNAQWDPAMNKNRPLPLSKFIHNALQDSIGQAYEASNIQSSGSSVTFLSRLITRSVTVPPSVLAATPSSSPSNSVSEANIPLNVSSFRYDIVDVTREVMTAIVLPGLHEELVGAYKARDLARTRSWGSVVLDAINDIDRILATHSHFMLGPWIRDARLSAKVVSSSKDTKADTSSGGTFTDAEKERYADYLEFNARNQITWWGPGGQQSLADYASKHWAGLVKEFYLPRWQIFVDRLVTAVQNGTTLDYKAYLQDSLSAETRWQYETTCLGGGCQNGAGKEIDKKYPVEAVEDTALVAQDLWDRWGQAAMRFAQKASK
ncbi:hypothetical protein BGX28_008293 [Mortierella sp. GBA30]|nr:hypothetical protein BGX28_008293 [Mortierella sp. GBA30]